MCDKVRILSKLTTSFIDYPDDVSIAVCVIMMGCTHGCKGCQNPYFQNPKYSKETREITVSNLYTELQDICKRNRTNKVVLSGGDPLAVYNIEFTKKLLEMNKQFDFCIYTGHNIDYVKNNMVKGFKFVKCGKFDITNYRKSEKNDTCMVFASPNQGLYDGDYNLLSENGIYKFN